MENVYVIGGKEYTQKALVLGQWRQLLDVLKGISIPADIDAHGLVNILDDRLALGLAIIINPAGIPLKEKDIPAIADELEFSADAETIFKIIDDFFACNPLPLILEKISQGAGFLSGILQTMLLTALSSASQPETLPAETQSSGDILQTNASPG
ncbi:MAG: hypothetical protein A4E66_00166 [Syntrophus sp. PtaB.Bin001]|nr:MAG: hypothetical protein A4E66_00166 [Syntrophus sp. PtaB.Bin001]